MVTLLRGRELDAFPEEVKRFLDEHIESIDQLEILRVLSEDPQRAWSTGDLAKAVQAPSSTVATQVAALLARGLVVTAAQGTTILFRHGQLTPQLTTELDHALQLYRERPVTMIRMVYARANERLKAFADAFKLRKES